MNKVSDYSNCLLARDFISNLLEKWEPHSFEANEKKQEKDLIHWLKLKLPNVPFTQQYGIARGSADIIIEDTFLIELKLPFTALKKVELDRCLGQLEHYKQKWVDFERGPVYLVIVGELESEFRDILEKAVKRLDSGNLLQWFYFIEKTLKPK